MEYIGCTYLQNLISFPACFFDVFQSIPHPAISLAKLELFTRKVATTVPTKISHRSSFLYYGNPKWLFYVDGSMPFGESGRFACMEALLLQAARPFIFQGAKLMSVLLAWEAIFFWAAQLAFELGSARAGSRVTPAGANVCKVLFRGSILFTERGVSRTREHRFCRATWSSGPASLPSLAHQSGRLGVLWQPGLSQRMFYVDGSTPFGESKRFACTRALFLQAAGPSISQGARTDGRFT